MRITSPEKANRATNVAGKRMNGTGNAPETKQRKRNGENKDELRRKHAGKGENGSDFLRGSERKRNEVELGFSSKNGAGILCKTGFFVTGSFDPAQNPPPQQHVNSRRLAVSAVSPSQIGVSFRLSADGVSPRIVKRWW